MTRNGITYPALYLSGDSLSVGYYVTAANKRFGTLLEASLIAAEWGSDEVFTSVETAGGRIDNKCLPYLRSQLAELQPSIVILEWGINHIGVHTNAEFQGYYEEMLDTVLEHGARVVVACTLFWFGYPVGSYGNGRCVAFSNIVTSLAASYGVLCADLYTPTVGVLATLSLPGESSYISPYNGDGMHPGDVGHQAIHDAIWAVLSPALGDRVAASGRGAAGTRGAASGRGVA